jgi:hypothetical protein
LRQVGRLVRFLTIPGFFINRAVIVGWFIGRLVCCIVLVRGRFLNGFFGLLVVVTRAIPIGHVTAGPDRSAIVLIVFGTAIVFRQVFLVVITAWIAIAIGQVPTIALVIVPCRDIVSRFFSRAVIGGLVVRRLVF